MWVQCQLYSGFTNYQIFQDESDLYESNNCRVASMENAYNIELAVDIQSPSPKWGKAGMGAVKAYTP
jgi:hypothetical protein